MPSPYLLDTNIVLELVRGGQYTADLEAKYRLLSGAYGNVYVPYVVRAELAVFRRGWSDVRLTEFERVMRGFQTGVCHPPVGAFG